MEGAAPQDGPAPVTQWELCTLYRQWAVGLPVVLLPRLLLLLLIHILQSFLIWIPHSSSFIYYLSTSLSDNVLISLSHTIIFTATKIKSFLMCYFDYCKRPETKQNGCSKCGVVKINSSDSCLGITGTLSCYCCEWRLVEKTLVLGWVWRCTPFQGCQSHEQGVGSSRVERRLAHSHWVDVTSPGCQIVKKESCSLGVSIQQTWCPALDTVVGLSDKSSKMIVKKRNYKYRI